MAEVTEIRISDIEPDPDQPRTEFDQDGLQELADSIRAIGLLQPITVKPLNGSGKFQIIAGERRWRSVCSIGWERVPAIVVEGDEKQAVMLQLSENITRRDLNPVEEARAYQHCLDRGYSTREIADAVGKRSADITWLIGILKAEENVLWAVAKGHVTANTAWYIAKLSKYNQGKVLKAMNEGLTQTQAVMLAERLFAEESQIDMFPETQVPEDHLRVARKTRSALEKAGAALTELIKIEEDRPGTIGAAMEYETERTIEQIAHLRKKLAQMQTALARKQIAGMKV